MFLELLMNFSKLSRLFSCPFQKNNKISKCNSQKIHTSFLKEKKTQLLTRKQNSPPGGGPVLLSSQQFFVSHFSKTSLPLFTIFIKIFLCNMCWRANAPPDFYCCLTHVLTSLIFILAYLLNFFQLRGSFLQKDIYRLWIGWTTKWTIWITNTPEPLRRERIDRGKNYFCSVRNPAVAERLLFFFCRFYKEFSC